MSEPNLDTSFGAVETQFNVLRRGYGSLPYPSVAVRKQRLLKLKALILDNQDALIAAISADFTIRASNDTLSAEVLPSIMGINDTMKKLGRWMKPERKFVNLLFQPATAKVLNQPLGVIGIIAPWNYPLFLTVGPLTSALAAGNVALVKVSEFTPNFGVLFERLVGEYFDETEIRVVNGDVSVAQAFSELPFDHMLFTGSTAVGKHIMRAASQNLTPVTLELGGKSPVVIDPSMPIREAAARLVFPKCVNAGQTCVAPDYVLCPKKDIEEFVQHFMVEAKRQFPTVSDNNDYTAIINDRQRARLVGYVEEAVAKGAKAHIAGESDDLADYGAKLPPILLTNVPLDCAVMQDEIFGPILPIIGYETLAEAVRFINLRPRPLALYVFGYDASLKPVFELQTHSGALVFNEAMIHVAMDNLPFGGVGPSGMGHYHGEYGFQTFSKAKPVLSKGRFSSLKLVYPPYKSWLMSSIMRIFGR
ncbi:coniferyl aldehyde dehydrogenase [Reinekea sp.]|jgi:coniferyl-aldehyde dehydrogenase|uniref:coniferyl aldehyde dehydrogenase n=1 Tax=Reinekea sp. TaxID=1970455 RepID=UPI00398A3489